MRSGSARLGPLDRGAHHDDDIAREGERRVAGREQARGEVMVLGRPRRFHDVGATLEAPHGSGGHVNNGVAEGAGEAAEHPAPAVGAVLQRRAQRVEADDAPHDALGAQPLRDGAHAPREVFGRRDPIGVGGQRSASYCD